MDEGPRDIGVDVKMPSGEWDGDDDCPFFGSLSVRGQIIAGFVASAGMQKTIIVERRLIRKMPKYERFERRTRRYAAHLPSCIGNVEVGDPVRIMECRPLSKTKSFVVIEAGVDV